MKNTIWNKVISWFLIAAFTLTSIQPGYSKTPGVSSKLIEAGNSWIEENEFNKQNWNLINIPSEIGKIRSVYTSDVPEEQTIIYHIQDAHCNLEAQQNIAHIVKYLIETEDVGFIGIEGASGLVDTEILARGEIELRQKLADEYMEKGLLTGVEYLGMMESVSKPYTVYGVESRDIYQENLRALKDTYKNRKKVFSFLNSLSKTLDEIESNILKTETLITLNNQYKLFLEGDVERRDFILELNKFINTKAAPEFSKYYQDKSRYTNFKNTALAAKNEASINFKKLQNEKQAFWKKITDDKYIENKTNFLKMEENLKYGDEAKIRYYQSIVDFSEENEFSIEFKELKKYLEVLHTFTDVRTEKLYGEMDEICRHLLMEIAGNPIEKAVIELDTCMRVMTRLVDLRLTRSQFRYFKENPEKIDIDYLIRSLKSLAKGADVKWSKKLDVIPLEVSFTLKAASDYYHKLIQRDHVMVNNILQEMNNKGVKKGVLITGGFHSEGMMDILRDQNVSYAVLSPKVGEPTDLYVDVMLDLNISGLARALITDSNLGIDNNIILERLLTQLEGKEWGTETNQNLQKDLQTDNLTPTQKIIFKNRLQNLRNNENNSDEVKEFLDRLWDHVKDEEVKSRNITIDNTAIQQDMGEMLTISRQFQNGEFGKAVNASKKYKLESNSWGSFSRLWTWNWFNYSTGVRKLEQVKRKAKKLSQESYKYSAKEIEEQIKAISNEMNTVLDQHLADFTGNQRPLLQGMLLRITNKTLIYLRDSVPPNPETFPDDWQKRFIDYSKKRMEYLVKNPQEFKNTAFHGTGSPVLGGLVQSSGDLMSMQALLDAGIVRRTGEGVALSKGNEPKKVVYISAVDSDDLSGLGSSFAYSDAQRKLPEYNLSLYTYDELVEKIKKLEIATTALRYRLHWQSDKNALGQQLGNEIWAHDSGKLIKNFDAEKHTAAKFEIKLKSLKAELERRNQFEQGDPRREGGTELHEDNYPVLFEFDTENLGHQMVKQTKGEFISGEGVVDYRLKMKDRIKRVYVPAKFLPLAQEQLKKIYGKEVMVLAMEAIDDVLSNQNPMLQENNAQHLKYANSSYNRTFENNSTATGKFDNVMDIMADVLLEKENDYRQTLTQFNQQHNYGESMAAKRQLIANFNENQNTQNVKAIRDYRKAERITLNRLKVQWDIMNSIIANDSVKQGQYATLMTETKAKIDRLQADVDALYDIEDSLRMRAPLTLAIQDETHQTFSSQLTVDIFDHGFTEWDGDPIENDQFQRNNISRLMHTYALDKYYKRVWPRKYTGNRPEYGSMTANEIAELDQTEPYFRTFGQSRLANYYDYIDSLSSEDQVNGDVPRAAHGPMHVSRVAMYTELLTFWHKENTQLTEEEKLKLENEIQHVQMAMALHDAGRMDDGKDFYDPISEDITKRFFDNTELPENTKKVMTSLVGNKDENIQEIEDLGFEVTKVNQLQHDIGHDADVIDVIRAKSNFDPKYIRAYKDLPDDSPQKLEFDAMLKEVKFFLTVTAKSVQTKLEFNSDNYYEDLLKVFKYAASQKWTDQGMQQHDVFPIMSKYLRTALDSVEVNLDEGPFTYLKDEIDEKMTEIHKDIKKADDENRQKLLTAQQEEESTGVTALKALGRNAETTLAVKALKISEIITQAPLIKKGEKEIIYKADLGEKVAGINFVKDGVTHIVLNNKLQFSQIAAEIQFHEEIEANVKNEISELELDDDEQERISHILASSEQILKFSDIGSLTAHHEFDLSNKSRKELIDLYAETLDGSRNVRNKVIEKFYANQPEKLQKLKAYEALLISRANEIYYLKFGKSFEEDWGDYDNRNLHQLKEDVIKQDKSILEKVNGLSPFSLPLINSIKSINEGIHRTEKKIKLTSKDIIDYKNSKGAKLLTQDHIDKLTSARDATLKKLNELASNELLLKENNLKKSDIEQAINRVNNLSLIENKVSDEQAILALNYDIENTAGIALDSNFLKAALNENNRHVQLLLFQKSMESVIKFTTNEQDQKKIRSLQQRIFEGADDDTADFFNAYIENKNKQIKREQDILANLPVKTPSSHSVTQDTSSLTKKRPFNQVGVTQKTTKNKPRELIRHTDGKYHIVLGSYMTGDQFGLLSAMVLNKDVVVHVFYDVDNEKEKKQALDMEKFYKSVLGDKTKQVVMNPLDKGAKKSGSRTRAIYKSITSTGYGGIKFNSVGAGTSEVARQFDSQPLEKRNQLMQKFLMESIDEDDRREIENFFYKNFSEVKNTPLLWTRYREDGASFQEKQGDTNPLVIEQLKNMSRSKLGKEALVIGDPLLNNENRSDNLVEFWNHPAFKGKTRQHQWYFLWLMAQNNNVLIGERSGALEGPALLGFPVIFLEEEGNGQSSRMEKWFGRVPGFMRLKTRNHTGGLARDSKQRSGFNGQVINDFLSAETIFEETNSKVKTYKADLGKRKNALLQLQNELSDILKLKNLENQIQIQEKKDLYTKKVKEISKTRDQIKELVLLLEKEEKNLTIQKNDLEIKKDALSKARDNSGLMQAELDHLEAVLKEVFNHEGKNKASLLEGPGGTYRQLATKAQTQVISTNNLINDMVKNVDQATHLGAESLNENVLKTKAKTKDELLKQPVLRSKISVTSKDAFIQVIQNIQNQEKLILHNVESVYRADEREEKKLIVSTQDGYLMEIKVSYIDGLKKGFRDDLAGELDTLINRYDYVDKADKTKLNGFKNALEKLKVISANDQYLAEVKKAFDLTLSKLNNADLKESFRQLENSTNLIQKNWSKKNLANIKTEVENGTSKGGFIGANEGSARITDNGLKIDEGTGVEREEVPLSELTQEDLLKLNVIKAKTKIQLKALLEDENNREILLKLLNVQTIQEVKLKIDDAIAALERDSLTFEKTENSKGQYFLAVGATNSDNNSQLVFDKEFMRSLLDDYDKNKDDSFAQIVLFHEALETVTPVGAHSKIRNLQKAAFKEKDRELTLFIQSFNLARQIHKDNAEQEAILRSELFTKLMSETKSTREEAIDTLVLSLYKNEINMNQLGDVIKLMKKSDIDPTPRLVQLLMKDILTKENLDLSRVRNLLSQLNLSEYEINDSINLLMPIIRKRNKEESQYKELTKLEEASLSMLGYRILRSQSILKADARRQLAGDWAEFLSQTLHIAPQNQEKFKREIKMAMTFTGADDLNHITRLELSDEQTEYLNRIKSQEIFWQNYESFLDDEDIKIFQLGKGVQLIKQDDTIKIKLMNSDTILTQNDLKTRHGMTLEQLINVNAAFKSEEKTTKEFLALRNTAREIILSEQMKNGDRKSLFIVDSAMNDKEMRQLIAYFQKIILNGGVEHHKMSGDIDGFMARAIDLGLLTANKAQEMKVRVGLRQESFNEFKDGKPLIVIGKGNQLNAFSENEKTILLDSSQSIESTMVSTLAFIKKDHNLIKELKKGITEENEAFDKFIRTLEQDNLNNLETFRFVAPPIKPLIETVLSQLADEEETVLIAG